jgi:hypothetical protein
MTKEIPLTRGKIALVDDEDFEELNKYLWSAIRKRKIFYAIRTVLKADGGHMNIEMHQQILEVSDGLKVDHINGNGLDNRRCNLRPCTNSQNLCNRGRTRNNTSGYKGVSWDKRAHKWEASIGVDGKHKHLGRFDSREDAARAYNEAAKRLHGNFARLNEIPSPNPDPNIDDIDGNGVDDQPHTNSRKLHRCRRQRNNTSGYKGVSWNKQCSKWRAGIEVNGRGINLGDFDSKEDAARAYNEAAKRAWGDDAQLNEIPRQD